MSAEYLDAMKEDFAKVEASLRRDLQTIRTGRASPQLLENVMVEVASYGAAMPLNQLGSITAPDARLLVVNPWDKSTLKDIERGIVAAGLGLNPSNDGQIVRIPIPVKMLGKHLEEARVRARGVRREYNDIFKELEAGKEVTEDELKQLLEKVQKATDAAIALLEGLAAAKEKEVLEG
jgi:ribosome recycling factor